MRLRRLTSKPRGILRDATIVAGLVFMDMKTGLLIAGLILFLLGAGLHVWSKGCLVRNWPLTTCGPYRIARHPFYLANLLIDIGICLISGNLWVLCLYILAFLLIYVPTIRMEEKSLKEVHGDEFVRYAREVPALIPFRLHRILGRQDLSWNNIVREKEVSRILRILAIPLYFIIVHIILSGHEGRVVSLAIAVLSALVLNVASMVIRKFESPKYSRTPLNAG
jgi:hypothetical protein